MRAMSHDIYPHRNRKEAGVVARGEVRSEEARRVEKGGSEEMRKMENGRSEEVKKVEETRKGFNSVWKSTCSSSESLIYSQQCATLPRKHTPFSTTYA